jgi:hypothetical protein
MKGQPAPEDIASGVFVCLGGMTTVLATKLRLANAILRCRAPASFAAVGGVPGVDVNQGAPSIFRFGTQNRDELTPARVTNTSI